MTFEAMLRIGHLGEMLAVGWLRARGYGVVPSYDYCGSSGDKAPRLIFLDRGFAVPDLDVCKSGKRSWIEVKTYEHTVLNRKRRCNVHSISKRHHFQYVKVIEETGTPGHLIVIEAETAEMRTRPLPILDGWGCECQYCQGGQPLACRNASNVRSGLYFKRDDMQLLHTFSDSEIEPIRRALKGEAA